MESFFAILKKDIIFGRRFKTREESKLFVIEYIKTFYNYKRLHSSLGNMSPMEYEHQFNTKKWRNIYKIIANWFIRKRAMLNNLR